MGRTLPPFSQLIEQERRAWAPFRRALRKADQAVFDQLFDCAKLHVQAGVYLSRPWPFEVIAMAILLEHHRLLAQVFSRLEEVSPGHPASGPSTPTVRHAPTALQPPVARRPRTLGEGRVGESSPQGNMFEGL